MKVNLALMCVVLLLLCPSAKGDPGTGNARATNDARVCGGCLDFQARVLADRGIGANAGMLRTILATGPASMLVLPVSLGQDPGHFDRLVQRILQFIYCYLNPDICEMLP